MQLITVIITRNKSASVKTLHSLLKLNIICIENNVHNRIMFVNDDYNSKKNVVNKKLKGVDRFLWIDYGISIDDQSLRHVVSRDWQWHGVIFPCVIEGINWEQFKKNIDTSEPLSQKGLEFDTSVNKHVRGDFYDIEKTNPRCFCIDTKHFLKNMKSEKILHCDFQDTFSKLVSTKFKMVAFTAANLIATYPHECLGSILGASGVKANVA